MTAVRPSLPVETGPGEVVRLDSLLDDWVETGVITPEQAALMGRPVTAIAAPRPLPILAEGLAYLGGAVVVAGCTLIAALYWGDLADGGRLALLAAAAALLLVAGIAVPPRAGAAGRRLRAVLWLASTGAWAGAAAVLVGGVLETALDVSPEAEGVLVATIATVYAGALWLAGRHALQQVGLMGSTAALAATLVAWVGWPDEPGVGVWAVGVAWFVLGARRVLEPRELGVLLGSATAVFGAMTTATSDAGMALTLGTVVAVVVTAVVARDQLLLGLGALATMINVPAAMARWFAGSAAAAAGLVVAGLALVAVAVWVARHGEPRRTRR